MYIKLSEVTLVYDQRKVQPSDPIVYERELRGERVFTTDGSPSQYVTDAVRYGHLYVDSRDAICIIPDAWNPDDAAQARLAIENDADAQEA